MSTDSPDHLHRCIGPCGENLFRRRTVRRHFGIPAYEEYDGPVFEVVYTYRMVRQASEVDPEGELSAEELDRRLAEEPRSPLCDARTSWWATREAAEAEQKRLLDEADPRLGEGAGVASVESQMRRDATSVWWASHDETPLWRAEAVVREHREVVERGEGVGVVLRRTAPNDRGTVASLHIAAADGTYFRTTGILPGGLRGDGADGLRSPAERKQEPALVARACARASELGEDVAAAVAAALARGAVTAYPMGDE